MDTFLSFPSLDAFHEKYSMLVALEICDQPSSDNSVRSSTAINALSLIPTAMIGQQGQQQGGNGGHIRMWTYKVAQRARNAHAHVNAGFLFHLRPENVAVTGTGRNTSTAAAGGYVAPGVRCIAARVVIGGVSKKTFIAQRTQRVLAHAVVNADTLQRALGALLLDLQEVGATETLLGDQSYRVSVMQSYLYRALLGCLPPSLLFGSNLATAVTPWIKPVSRGL